MRKAILLISLMLVASSAVADEAQRLPELFDGALGYKIGGLKIEELLAKAQHELGPIAAQGGTR